MNRPLALLVVAAVLIRAWQVLARVEGVRLYGMVQAYGEIVGVIGLIWLVAAGRRRELRPDRR